jgi:hypothetical protein
MSAVPRRSPMLVALRPPRQFDARGRIELIGEAARALRDGKMPSPEASMFLGSALLSWLENGRGGDLATRFLRVVTPKSHHTPQALWRLIRDEQSGAQAARSVSATATDEASK